MEGCVVVSKREAADAAILLLSGVALYAAVAMALTPCGLHVYDDLYKVVAGGAALFLGVRLMLPR
jgi:hypothetical protein